MTALLAQGGLSGYPLSQLAQAGSGTVYVVLARLQGRGWVDRQQQDGGAGHPRFTYALTGEGRAAVTRLLGLPAREG